MLLVHYGIRYIFWCNMTCNALVPWFGVLSVSQVEELRRDLRIKSQELEVKNAAANDKLKKMVKDQQEAEKKKARRAQSLPDPLLCGESPRCSPNLSLCFTGHESGDTGSSLQAAGSDQRQAAASEAGPGPGGAGRHRGSERYEFSSLSCAHTHAVALAFTSPENLLTLKTVWNSFSCLVIYS